jgi:hypothetical protein
MKKTYYIAQLDVAKCCLANTMTMHESSVYFVCRIGSSLEFEPNEVIAPEINILLSPIGKTPHDDSQRFHVASIILIGDYGDSTVLDQMQRDLRSPLHSKTFEPLPNIGQDLP